MTRTEHRVVVRTCARMGCTRKFDAASSYGGKPRAATRRYCKPRCAADERNRVRRLQAEHDRRYASLVEMHRLERAGQRSLVETPLPEVPARPERSAS